MKNFILSTILGYCLFKILGGFTFENRNVTTIPFNEFVEAYYPKNTSKPVLVYNRYGGDVVDTLYEGTKYQWYVFALSESKPDFWFRIENVFFGPDDYQYDFHNLKGKWLCTDQLLINFSDKDDNMAAEEGVWVFADHNITSQVVYQTAAFRRTRLLSVWKNWAKVSIDVRGGEIEGWIEKPDQCSAPWTNCTTRGSYHKTN